MVSGLSSLGGFFNPYSNGAYATGGGAGGFAPSGSGSSGGFAPSGSPGGFGNSGSNGSSNSPDGSDPSGHKPVLVKNTRTGEVADISTPQGHQEVDNDLQDFWENYGDTPQQAAQAYTQSGPNTAGQTGAFWGTDQGTLSSVQNALGSSQPGQIVSKNQLGPYA